METFSIFEHEIHVFLAKFFISKTDVSSTRRGKGWGFLAGVLKGDFAFFEQISMPVKMPCIEFQVKMPSKTVRFFKFFSKVTRKNGLVFGCIFMVYFKIFKEKSCKNGSKQAMALWQGF